MHKVARRPRTVDAKRFIRNSSGERKKQILHAPPLARARHPRPHDGSDGGGHDHDDGSVRIRPAVAIASSPAGGPSHSPTEGPLPPTPFPLFARIASRASHRARSARFGSVVIVSTWGRGAHVGLGHQLSACQRPVILVPVCRSAYRCIHGKCR
jgi:hypothetical protein